MKHEPIRPAPLPLVDDYAAPQVFATGVSGLGLVHGALLVTLEAARCDHTRADPVMERVVTGRLVLTVPAAQALMLGLHDYLAQNGLSPSQGLPAASTATRQ